MGSHSKNKPHGPAVSRRTLMVLGGTALVAAAVPAALFLDTPHGPAVEARQFVALLADPAGAASLGKIWFEESRPGEIRTVYEMRFARRLREHGWVPGMDIEATHHALADCVRADYAAARTVPIREWQLSETEADLCALAALTVPDQDHAPAGGETSEPAHG